MMESKHVSFEVYVLLNHNLNTHKRELPNQIKSNFISTVAKLDRVINTRLQKEGSNYFVLNKEFFS